MTAGLLEGLFFCPTSLGRLFGLTIGEGPSVLLAAPRGCRGAFLVSVGEALVSTDFETCPISCTFDSKAPGLGPFVDLEGKPSRGPRGAPLGHPSWVRLQSPSLGPKLDNHHIVYESLELAQAPKTCTPALSVNISGL